MQPHVVRRIVLALAVTVLLGLAMPARAQGLANYVVEFASPPSVLVLQDEVPAKLSSVSLAVPVAVGDQSNREHSATHGVLAANILELGLGQSKSRRGIGGEIVSSGCDIVLAAQGFQERLLLPTLIRERIKLGIKESFLRLHDVLVAGGLGWRREVRKINCINNVNGGSSTDIVDLDFGKHRHVWAEFGNEFSRKFYDEIGPCIVLHDGQLPAHHLPLVFGVPDILARQNRNDDRGQRGNESTVSSEKPADCYQSAHKVSGGLPLIVGCIACFFRFGGVGTVYSRRHGAPQLSSGILVLLVGAWIINAGLDLMEFSVFPCASGSIPLPFFTLSAHAKSLTPVHQVSNYPVTGANVLSAEQDVGG